MPTPFPGMDPYLEQAGIWEEVHTQLIVDLARALNRQLAPRYRVAIEQRSYMSLVWTNALVGLPDIMVVESEGSTQPTQAAATGQQPTVVELPMPYEVVERYLEIRTLDDRQRVVTAIEVLSPTNKLSYEGRELYLAKRLKVLASNTNLVELDLLRAGQPMPMRKPGDAKLDYRILVSRASQRPASDL
jgi:hypothetical protein